MKNLFVCTILLFLLSQGKSQQVDAYSFPPGKEGLLALGAYLESADIYERLRFTYELLPKRSEYEAVFQPEKIRQIQKFHRRWYRKVSPAIGPRQDSQRVVICHEATAQEIVQETGEGKHFPGGYREIADWFLPEITLYRMTFVEQGKRVGTSFDVFVYLEDHWRVFPKPWKARKE